MVKHRTQKDYSKLVGRPYDRVNCWDLVREFYMQQFEIELSHYYEGSDLSKRENISSLIHSNKGSFEPVESKDIEFGDLILIKVRGIESHIAVYVGNGMMLHSSKTTGSVLDRIARWENTITGYYRHKGRIE
jgi:cell wall-associated NlpC family hydrolase